MCTPPVTFFEAPLRTGNTEKIRVNIDVNLSFHYFIKLCIYFIVFIVPRFTFYVSKQPGFRSEFMGLVRVFSDIGRK